MEPQEIHRWASTDPGNALNAYNMVRMCIFMCMCVYTLFSSKERIQSLHQKLKRLSDWNQLNSTELLCLPKYLAHFMYLQSDFLSHPQNQTFSVPIQEAHILNTAAQPL